MEQRRGLRFCVSWIACAAASLLCLQAGLAGASAQAASGERGAPAKGADGVPTLHVYSNLVQIPTLVLDENRAPVAPVSERRFFVSLDGGPRFRVTHARLEGDDPISLAIVLDVSQPFPSVMQKAEEAFAALSPEWLKPHDHVTVYAMDCKLSRSLDDAPADAATLRRGVDAVLEQWRAHGRTRWNRSCKNPLNLWDSLMYVTGELRGLPGRRVVLAVTDGLDRGSKATWNEVRVQAQQSGVAVFGMTQSGGMYSYSPALSPENQFNGLCELTGGMVLHAERKTLAAELQRFTTLLRGRYIIEFPHPVDTEGGRHGMDITIDKLDAFIRPAGASVPKDDPAVLNDPATIPGDPENTPQLGKRKLLTPQ
jgi:hypothetical protein